jgi:hypothetical protein
MTNYSDFKDTKMAQKHVLGHINQYRLIGNGQIPCAHFDDDRQGWAGAVLGIRVVALSPA